MAESNDTRSDKEAPEGFEVFDPFDFANAMAMIESLAERIDNLAPEQCDLPYSIRAIARLRREQLQGMSPFWGQPKTVLYVRKGGAE